MRRVCLIGWISGWLLIQTAHAASVAITPPGWDPTPYGFLLTGKASGITALRARLEVEGKTRLDKLLVISPKGSWAVAIPPGVLQAGETASLRLEDKGIALGKYDFKVIPVGESVQHLINRITFGPSPELIKNAKQQGWVEFLDQQLHPESLSDSLVEQNLSKIPQIQGEWLPDLQFAFLYRMLFSQRQLNELMTWFWENHFNTYALKHGRKTWEAAENQAFRQNALGRFRDLLGISAKSAAMLAYLDNHKNRKGAINENYARELLELHTLGVTGGYTQQDVVEVARAFTGWRYRWDKEPNPGSFFFDAKQHDTGPKLVLGQILPAGRGIEDGEVILDLLAQHPSTAQFLCHKLAQFFVSDNPHPNTVQECAETFLLSGGDIRQILVTLLTTSEFKASFHAKLKTPLRVVTSTVRALQPERIGTRDLTWQMRLMGLNLFSQAIPTGYPECANAWINSYFITQRLSFANHFAFLTKNPDYSPKNTYLVNPTQYFANLGLETAEGIVGYLFQILTAGDYSPKAWQTAYALLGDGFVLTNTKEADSRLRAVISFVLGLGEAQLY